MRDSFWLLLEQKLLMFSLTTDLSVPKKLLLKDKGRVTLPFASVFYKISFKISLSVFF